MNQQNIPAFTVTDLNRYIKTLLSADEVLSAVVVRGEISNFKQFDIDFNKEKYLIETRLSGALTRPFSAIALEEPSESVAG